MVRLKKLVLKNFKSFAGNIAIPFNSNFIIICGPNGAGKSNIIDAITFVIGAKRAKHIRAQKLENLIFNGGKNRKPAEWCEVSLILENSKGMKITQIEDGEDLRITRRVNRSGISVYKLNGRVVSKSKIMDILLQLGIRADGHNILMQGDVTRLIDMSPIERKKIIDEISGIAEFDEKKERAMKELESVETRIREVMLLVAEKERIVKQLKKDKEDAELYQKLLKEKKLYQATMYKKKLKNIEHEIKYVNLKIKSYQKDIISEKYDEYKHEITHIEKDIRVISDEILNRSRNRELYEEVSKLRAQLVRRKERLNMIEKREESKIYDAIKNKAGVLGLVSDILKIPDKYEIAIEVALGSHKNDIVVENKDVAIECIKYLKAHKLGRARFIPLNVKYYIEEKEKDSIDIAFNIVNYEKKFKPVIGFVLGKTLIAKNIDKAKNIKKRVVTLDGDLIEESGVIIGGYYKANEKIKLKKEIKMLENRIKKLEELQIEEDEKIRELYFKRKKLEEKLLKLRKEFDQIFEKEQKQREELMNLKIRKAQLESDRRNILIALKEFVDIKQEVNLSIEELEKCITEIMKKIRSLEPVNLRAIEEYEIHANEYEETKKRLEELLEEKKAIENTIMEIENKRYEKFMLCLNTINENFKKIYNEMTNGDANIRLEEQGNIDSGLIIEASPEGKRVVNLDAMSGGEKTLTSLAFLFAVQQYFKAPFYILDEADAMLDKINSQKVANLIKIHSSHSQFIIISHNDITVRYGDEIFGVSMENGVSKIFAIKMPEK